MTIHKSRLFRLIEREVTSRGDRSSENQLNTLQEIFLGQNVFFLLIALEGCFPCQAVKDSIQRLYAVQHYVSSAWQIFTDERWPFLVTCNLQTVADLNLIEIASHDFPTLLRGNNDGWDAGWVGVEYADEPKLVDAQLKTILEMLIE